MDDDTDTTAMNLAEALRSLLLGEIDTDVLASDCVPIGRIDTFEEAGLLTSDDGLVVTLENGTQFQVTIVRSR